jgi:hypothetical protein
MKKNSIQQRLYNDQLAWATKVVALAKANLRRGKKIATGTLYNSISFTISKKGEVKFLADDSAGYVEGGRPRFPGRGVNLKGKFANNIKDWAKVKGLPRFRDKKGRYISNDSRAFLIARSINEKGIKPFPFYTDAVEQSLDLLAESLGDGMTSSVTKIFDDLEI